jgi:peptidoglycan hydrolase-like protein with peptidoglycan-binding domain
MKPNESFVNQPIRSLQTMLRVIAEHDHELLSVVPDGFFTVDTSRAVSAFQRRYGLPVTGVADQQTWDAIVPVYEAALVEVGEAEPLILVLEPNQIIRKDEEDLNLFVVQAVLTVLSRIYASIPAPGMSGVLDIPTSDSLSAFQELSLLPVTGELDKNTWKQLALHYPMAAIHGSNP